MPEILESEWTLSAVKHREEERLRSARAERESVFENIQTPHAPYVSGDNWIAEAFRRRQEEERAKTERYQPVAGDRAEAESREVPVDNWLIEGFKRHQEEERRVEFISRSDDAGAPAAIGDDDENSPERALVVFEELSPLALEESLGREARGDDQVPSGAVGALVTIGGKRPPVRRPRGPGRLIAIAGVVLVALVSLFGLKTALWNSGDSPRGLDRGASSAAPPPKAALPKARQPAKKEGARPAPPAPSHGDETTHAPPVRPADAAPAKPGDAATIPAPPAEAPQSSTKTPVAPGPQPETKPPSPSAKQSGDTSAPAETPSAPAPAAPKEAASPATPAKDLTAKPASVGPEGSREAVAPEPEQNASEPNRHAPNANVDVKSKPQSKVKRGGRRSSRNSDGFSTFLKRTANSVRRFFGRLGAQQ